MARRGSFRGRSEEIGDAAVAGEVLLVEAPAAVAYRGTYFSKPTGEYVLAGAAAVIGGVAGGEAAKDFAAHFNANDFVPCSVILTDAMKKSNGTRRECDACGGSAEEDAKLNFLCNLAESFSVLAAYQCELSFPEENGGAARANPEFYLKAQGAQVPFQRMKAAAYAHGERVTSLMCRQLDEWVVYVSDDNPILGGLLKREAESVAGRMKTIAMQEDPEAVTKNSLIVLDRFWAFQANMIGDKMRFFEEASESDPLVPSLRDSARQKLFERELIGTALRAIEFAGRKEDMAARRGQEGMA